MRKLQCKQVSGVWVQEVLDEFNDRRQEFGIADSDILSVSVIPATSETPIMRPDGTKGKPLVEVVIVYWDND